MQTIEQRVESLEKGQRRWKLVSAALAIGLVGVCVLAAGPEGVPDVIRCHKLEVVNGAGKVTASLEDAMLELTDDRSTSHATIDPAGLYVGDEKDPNLSGVSITASRKDGGAIEVRGRSLKGHVNIRIAEDGTGELLAGDGSMGHTVWSSRNRK